MNYMKVSRVDEWVSAIVEIVEYTFRPVTLTAGTCCWLWPVAGYQSAPILIGITGEQWSCSACRTPTHNRISWGRVWLTCGPTMVYGSDFLAFDALRYAAQSVSRALYGKTDYSILIFADKRFSHRNISWLPKWIRQFLSAARTQLRATSRRACPSLANGWS